MLRGTLVVVLVVASASIATAQSNGYVQAGLLATEQPAGTPNHRVYPGLGGRTVGVTAAAGVFVTPTLAVEGEIVASRPVATEQQFTYNWRENYTAESRDVFIGANARWRPIARRPLELVVGGGLAISRSANRSIVVTETFAIPPRPPTSRPDQAETSVGLSVAGGVATPLPVSARIEVVPAFTVRLVTRAGDGLGGYAGVGSYAYQFGAAVRFTRRDRRP